MWASYRAHGDPLPLPPDWIECSAERSGLPFPRRGAWTARALNTLGLHGSNSDFDQQLKSVRPNKPQQAVASRILKCLRDAGEPPEGLTPLSAFESLGGGKCLYAEEPKNLAHYDFNKLKVVQSVLKPRSVEHMLPPYAKSILSKSQTMIEKSSQELIDQGPIDTQPYWDPKLKHSASEKRRLIVALANQGLITFRTHIKERIGLFFVKKKTPEWIRMVVDARRVNASHREPPSTRLSTPRSFLDLQLPVSKDNSPMAYGIEADVCDCFYNYYCEALASWFGIDMLDSIDNWVSAGWKPTDLFDDHSQSYSRYSGSTTVYPVFRGLCMGWSWSLYFANESVAFITGGSIPRPLCEIRDKTPLPSLDDGPITGVYVDNISIIGKTLEETQQMADCISKYFSDVDIPLTWSTTEPTTVFETVGLVLDFERGEIRNKAKRLWRAFFAGQEILRRRRVATKVLEVWLGHMTSIFMISPHALSCFFHIYRYIQQHRDGRSTLWGEVRHEIRLSLGMIWLSCSSIRFDPVYHVDAGDASSSAYALLYTLATPAEVRHLIKWRESWRYQPMPTVLKSAAETGSRDKVLEALTALEGDPDLSYLLPQEIRPGKAFGAGLQTQYADWLLELVGDPHAWQKTSAMASQFKARGKSRKLSLEASTLVPPVPQAMCDRRRYTLLWRKKWRSADWHINIKEAAVCLSSLRRTARSTSLHEKVKVTLTDNLASLFGFERGRSSSWALNQYCRAAASYTAATGIRWRIRHIETLRNPADRDSRFDKPVKKVQVCRVRSGPPASDQGKIFPQNGFVESPFLAKNRGLNFSPFVELGGPFREPTVTHNQVDTPQDSDHPRGFKSTRSKTQPSNCIEKPSQNQPTQIDKADKHVSHSSHLHSRTSCSKHARTADKLQGRLSDESCGGKLVEGGTSPVQGQHQSNPSVYPKSLSYKRGGVFLEIFSGSGRFTNAVDTKGGGVLTGIDFLQGPHHDLRRRTTQLVVLSWIRSGRVRYVHLGTPCTVFSPARHGIRNFQRAHDREREGLEFALFTAEVIETCNRYHVYWSLENPQRSKLFSVPLLSRQLQESHVKRFELDFCMYGEAYRKPTSIFTNLDMLQELVVRCVHTRHQEVLRGSERNFVDGKWITAPKTKRAGAYPHQLVAKWAQIICPLLSPFSRDIQLLQRQWEHELIQAAANSKHPEESICSSLAKLQHCQQNKGWLAIVQQFEKVEPKGTEAIGFGQHTTQETQRRRRRAKKTVEDKSIKQVLGRLYQK